MGSEFQRRKKVKFNHWSVDIAPAKSISMRSVVIVADIPDIPSRMPLQCSSLYHRFFGATVMCSPAHARPVLPFGPSPNNCRSEHIHTMLLSNVAVTTEQHQGTYMGLILVNSFILYVCHLSCYWI